MDDDNAALARIEHCPGQPFQLGGLRQCDRCKRWWAPEDIQDFGTRPADGRAYPPICLRCVAERSQKRT